ncbi:hypothetical protein CIW51_08040 [Mycolicibacterium sp. P9-22]|nr:hypothetical protein CIW51_08040 [Mycolicibacterium sp. P9-22]
MSPSATRPNPSLSDTTGHTRRPKDPSPATPVPHPVRPRPNLPRQPGGNRSFRRPPALRPTRPHDRHAIQHPRGSHRRLRQAVPGAFVRVLRHKVVNGRVCPNY